MQYTNAGNYSVMIENSFGHTNSQPAELLVRPSIIGGFFLSNHTFLLTFNGTPGKTYAVESLLNPPNWTLLETMSSAAVRWQYIDTAAPASSNRLYRLRLLP